MSRSRSPLKHPLAGKLVFTSDDLRWATPHIVAEWRAKRLQCGTIADLGCGVGFQLLSFAAHCRKVIAVEKDGRKLDAAKENANRLGLKNITFIHGDVLDPAVIAQLPKLDIVFCDPERLPSEKERSVASITPDIRSLIKTYSKLTDKIAIEFPPQMRAIPFDAEHEYISVDGALNRLTLYFGKLKRAERSAELLSSISPSPDSALGWAVLRGKEQEAKKVAKRVLNFLYEVDPAVAKAGLLGKLQEETKALLLSGGTAGAATQKAALMTSSKLIGSAFWKSTFHVLAALPFSEKGVKKRLEQLGAGNVVLRMAVDAADYWDVRKRFEGRGEKTVHLFRIGSDAVIGEMVGGGDE
ncbi:methyltransferase domain-containing protein [Candidatus Woesearchaeota archaeon]|nr:methyltransferase domain-containing protein [Candidatus Woesearchaeota archaeon]